MDRGRHRGRSPALRSDDDGEVRFVNQTAGGARPVIRKRRPNDAGRGRCKPLLVLRALVSVQIHDVRARCESASFRDLLSRQDARARRFATRPVAARARVGVRAAPKGNVCASTGIIEHDLVRPPGADAHVAVDDTTFAILDEGQPCDDGLVAVTRAEQLRCFGEGQVECAMRRREDDSVETVIVTGGTADAEKCLSSAADHSYATVCIEHDHGYGCKVHGSQGFVQIHERTHVGESAGSAMQAARCALTQGRLDASDTALAAAMAARSCSAGTIEAGTALVNVAEGPHTACRGRVRR